MTIGQRIHLKRIEKDMTLEELAVRVGVSRQTLSRYETGVIGNIPSDKMELLADALNTTPAFLMGWIASNRTPEQASVENDAIIDAFHRASPEIQQAVLRILNKK